MLRTTGGPSPKLWVAGRARRYSPALGDGVIGIIIDRHGEGWGVDVGAPFPLALPALSFEGATRRNRPDLRAGDLVFGRVSSTGRPGEEGGLVCTDAAGRAAGYGPLRGGTLVRTTTAHARRLLGGEDALWPPSARRAWRLRLRSASTGGCGWAAATRRPWRPPRPPWAGASL